jgi:hypothetical protein
MRFSLNIVSSRWKITFWGIAGVIVLLAIFSIPNLMAESLDPVRAEDWIRSYLKQQAMNRRMEDLRIEGISSPNAPLARKWKTDLVNVDRMQFVSLEIKHFLIAPPGSTTRIFVAKTVIRQAGKEDQTRYFSLSARNRAFDFFWVNEHSQWMWMFSI